MSTNLFFRAKKAAKIEIVVDLPSPVAI